MFIKNKLQNKCRSQTKALKTSKIQTFCQTTWGLYTEINVGPQTNLLQHSFTKKTNLMRQSKENSSLEISKK